MEILEGIVLRERPVGEQDKFIDILTRERGVLELSVKGARKINGKSGSSTQLFAYSRFCVQERKEHFFLNSAEPIHIFYDLRSSLTRLSLASYFSEVLRYCCVEEQSTNNEILRLFLNTLYFLEKGLRSEPLLKSIFELRLMSEIGFMPNIAACTGCGEYEPEESCFFINDGEIFCNKCCCEINGNTSFDNTTAFKVNLPILKALRHIVLSDYDRLYNFRLSEHLQYQLSAITETYLTAHLERSFLTLNFYKSLH